MEFRWVALITLWTLLGGPVIGVPTGAAARKPAARSAQLPTAKVTAAR
jgi:hypothetical protein